MKRHVVRAGPALASAAIIVLGPGGSTRAAFERLPAGPESAALGSVFAVSTDPVFGNPAPALGGPSLHGGAWGSRPFGLSELFEAQVAVHWRQGAAAVGFGLRRFGTSAYAEKEVRGAAGWEASRELAVGGVVRGLSVEGAGFAPRRALAFDAGMRVRPDPASEVAAVLEAILGEVPGDSAGRQRRTALGASRRFGRLTVRVEMQRRDDRPLAGVVGLEWTPLAPVVIRAGVREDPSSLAWGFTVQHARFDLAASATHTALGRTLRVGVATSRGPQL
jgi:hypothetical protein